MYITQTWGRWGKILLMWTLSSTIGGGVAYMIALGFSTLFASNPNSFFAIWIPIGALVGGIAAGLEQHRILKNELGMPRSWIWVTAAGWVFGVPLLILISSYISFKTQEMDTFDAIMIFAGGATLAGVVSGLGQWALLRKRVGHPNWWLLASGIGWMMAWVVTLGMAFLLRGDAALPSTIEDVGPALVLGVIAGGMVGFEKGVALVGLFAQDEWEKMRAARLKAEKEAIANPLKQ